MSQLEEEIRPHWKIQNWRAFSYLLADYATIVGLAMGAEWTGSLWAKALAWVLIAGRQVALTNLVHAAAHGSLFTSKRLNEGLDVLLGYPLLESVHRYRAPHLEHHRSVTMGDPRRYEYLHGELKLDHRGPWGRTWIVFLRPLLGYETLLVLWDTFRIFADDLRLAGKVIAFWVVVALVATKVGSLQQVLIYWFGPLFLIYPIFYVWAEISDHFGPPDETRNQAGLFYALLLKGHEPYHAIHHSYPFLPFYRLKAVHGMLAARGTTPPVCRGFSSFLRTVYAGLDRVNPT